jgi:hypothetical protein
MKYEEYILGEKYVGHSNNPSGRWDEYEISETEGGLKYLKSLYGYKDRSLTEIRYLKKKG